MVFLIKYDWEVDFKELLQKQEKQIVFSPRFLASPDETVHRWKAAFGKFGPAQHFWVWLLLNDNPCQMEISVKLKIKVFDENNHNIFEGGTNEFRIMHEGLSKERIPILQSLDGKQVKRIRLYIQFNRNETFRTFCHISTNLGEDFSKLYDDKDSADFTLISGNQQFKVHKNILMARSPVFNAMFKNVIKEAPPNTLTLQEIEPEAVTVFLKFLYSGIVTTIPLELIEGIIDLSEKYDVKDLTSFCASDIRSNITVASAVKMLLLANKYGFINTKKDVLAFIKRNLQEVRQSDAWRSSMNQNLMEDILDIM